MRVQKDPTVSVHAWFSARDLLDTDLIDRLGHSQFTGAILSPDEAVEYDQRLSPSLLRVVQLHANETDEFLDEWDDANRLVILSDCAEVLEVARQRGILTCLDASITDGESLHAAIDNARANRFVLLRFTDPTNIPMELVIAELQNSQTIVLKDIPKEDGVEAARISLGVMENGSDGVVFTPSSHAAMASFMEVIEAAASRTLTLQTARITQSRAVGMGQRSCIDTATLFSESEGMIVGSTSQGGFLCCSEVFFLPYMEKRPFRINAGGIHSYVYSSDGRTQYMSELRAGALVSVVSTEGVSRNVPVGRVKTEVRPLRLLEAEFESGERINILMQDDWHVRIFGADGSVRNITELKPGDEVLAHLAEPGRHVGIAVSETIEEW
ncbi:3-dehydroquinate synthase II [Actinomyces wuliandei]|uniref:3-dehydroquinate synthase II n=1 Tax=Actinomyces wuliandei TaxID=2057743 RepID=UPI000FD9731A|nr:3-dehydroquinate synthase II [Actinomyces wuliandei]